MAEQSTQSPSLRPAASERLQQHGLVVTVGAVDHQLKLQGQGLLVTVDPAQHRLSLAVEPVQVGQAGSQALCGIGDPCPGVLVRRDLLGHPVRRAGQVERLLVREVPVDGQSCEAGLLGDAAMPNGCLTLSPAAG
jgi:hypothetical protein